MNKLFDPSSPDKYYLSWVGDVGHQTLLQNIKNRFSRPYVASALINLGHDFKGIILDLMWHRCSFTCLPEKFCEIFTSHLGGCRNLRGSLRFLAKNHPSCSIELVDVDFQDVPKGSIDVILCVRALEHFPNPTDVFKKLLIRNFDLEGLFIEDLRAGIPKHLGEALTDWYKKEGARILESSLSKK